VIGTEYSTCELVDILKSDTDYYRKSGGGVTFSGGEPLLHVTYLTEVLRALKRADIHIAIQTCGFFDIDSFRNYLLPYIDLVYFDLKLIDPSAHRDFTGVDNGLILANFSTLAKKLGERLVPRIPLVPEITATAQNLSGIDRFLQKCGYDSCDVLPYNPAGIAKRHRMGQPVPSRVSSNFMGRDEERELLDSFRRQLESGSITLH
jgi:pyruvate formate lyase activating enzyme